MSARKSQLVYTLIVCSAGALAFSAALVACDGSSDPNIFVDPGADAQPAADGASDVELIVIPDAGEAGQRETGPATVCGNGIKNSATETCDDGNVVAGDGCNARCITEPGWLCNAPGVPCTAIKCGDGLKVGDEDCDDGNATPGDGCSAKCIIEQGFKCPTANVACTPTTCGDNRKEGVEQCDDGNLDPFDGCDPECKVEPACANGSCTSPCGDGLKFPAEQCDDGNTRNGDGCSSTCRFEPGFLCTASQAPAPPFKKLYIAYRDFMAAATSGGHPDFKATSSFGLATGLVKPLLDAQGKPEFLSQGGSLGGVIIVSQASLSAWYRDTAFSKKTVSTLQVTRQPNGTYLYDNPSFYPLDAVPNKWPETFGDDNGVQRNFLFTSELRIPFTYKGGEVLDFRGDDDVWVFVNGRLVVDLGGVKGAQAGSVTLTAAIAAQANLVVGGFYEFAVFQAERNPTQSNYQLSLSDFDKITTSCASKCGDGVKTPNEVCDDGAANNTGGYGKCSADCTRSGPFCGDGIVQSANGELCDGTPECSSDCRLKIDTPN